MVHPILPITQNFFERRTFDPAAPSRKSRHAPANFAARRFTSASAARPIRRVVADLDKMDEVIDGGHAELLDNGSIKVTLDYHNGDEAIRKAKRDTSSIPARLRPD